MENTGKIMFQDDTKPVWYIAVGERWLGPLAAEDVYERIMQHQITWAHYIWRESQGEWKRICDVPVFKAALPSKPAREKLPPKPPSSDRSEERSWFLYYNDSQFGPFSTSEVERYLQTGKIHGKIHVWRDGMSEWKRLETVKEFAVKKAQIKPARRTAQPPPPQSTARDKREMPRKPLVARIMFAKDDRIAVAICRDVSVGGMQVLTDLVPGKAGDRIKLNVTPPGDDRGGNIKPFVAEGVIVRILDDGRGFSFRFGKLPDEARRAIEDYIQFTGI
ncbi:MAG: hypothetical protein A2583_08385 [Bdellovibrionales bacterium RIFOXYD1_FULL_53_11]|nr:MAG: hypothetical protein A2583_08385 [Bdellovibrionales bacterium RIFOXYD1_FULL_53_11]